MLWILPDNNMGGPLNVKAFVYKRYGPPDVLEMTEVPRPVPADNELLIRIRASTVSSADWRMRSLELPRGFGLAARLAIGIRGPRKPILGTEFSGVVEAVGHSVKLFNVGDPVFAFPGAALGCHADYRCIAADGAVAMKPANLSFEQAAALCFGGATMLDFFRRARLRSGERVLINGASGTVGTAAVQLARHFDAHVTAVCGTANIDLVRSLGAHEVIDYTRDDFARSVTPFDVIVDTAGTAPFARSAPVLSQDGRLILILAGLADLLKAPWQTLRSGKRVIAGPAAERPEYVHQLAELAGAGRFVPVVDRCYPFAQMIDAHRTVDRGRKVGSVVIVHSSEPVN